MGALAADGVDNRRAEGMEREQLVGLFHERASGNR